MKVLYSQPKKVCSFFSAWRTQWETLLCICSGPPNTETESEAGKTFSFSSGAVWHVVASSYFGSRTAPCRNQHGWFWSLAALWSSVLKKTGAQAVRFLQNLSITTLHCWKVIAATNVSNCDGRSCETKQHSGSIAYILFWFPDSFRGLHLSSHCRTVGPDSHSRFCAIVPSFKGILMIIPGIAIILSWDNFDAMASYRPVPGPHQ